MDSNKIAIDQNEINSNLIDFYVNKDTNKEFEDSKIN